MPNDDYITDDYVADLLAKEASTSSLKYSGSGMGDPQAAKKPANMPRPNKRFLERIIQSTNSHNANLLASEAAESKARLRTLEKAEEREKRKQATPQDVRRRQLGDIKAILGNRGSKSRDHKDSTQEGQAASDGADGRHSSPSSKRRRLEDRSASPPRRKTESRRRDRDSTKQRDADARSESDEETHRRRRSHRSRSRSRDNHHKRHRRRSRSPLRNRDSRKSRPREHKEDREKTSERGNDSHSRRSSSKGRREEKRSDRHRERSPHHSAPERPRKPSASDSDPLDDIIGPAPAPAPAVRTRGRGFQSRSSGMDRRFEEDYDPNADVDMDEETGQDDWDNAVETFRDRKKWQQSQEQRLRSAGFDDDDIKKWKKGGVLDEEDVRWSKAGEQREWDRGKGDDLKGIFSADN